MFLLENVKGLKSHQKGKTMNIIINSLEDAGYTVYWKVLDSHEFGVPQKEKDGIVLVLIKILISIFRKGLIILQH